MGQTPPTIVKLSPSTPATRSATPKRGARCSLFNTPSKKLPASSKEQIKTTKEAPSEDDASVGASAEDASVTVEDGDGQSLSQKNKGPAGDKDDGLKIKRARKNK